MKKILIPILLLISSATAVFAQDIIYADVNKADVQRMNFEIIGKNANNYLIYKEVKGKRHISVYDENMRLLNNVPISNLPKNDDLLDISFFPGTNFSNLIYQYQLGNVVNLMALRVEANGSILNNPLLLDTTIISYKADSKIYNVVTNNEQNKIMFFKINRKDKSLYKFSSILYDNNLSLINENQFTVPMENAGHRLGSYSLSDEGNLVFIKYNRLVSGNIAEASLIEQGPRKSGYNSYPLDISTGTNAVFLDDIKLKIDGQNNRYLLASFYSNSKKGNIDGLYVSAFSINDGKKLFEKTTTFTDDLRKRAKSSGALKSVFDDFFINNIVVGNDGSFTIASEALYTSGGSSWNRWGYWGSPFYSPWYGSWGGYWSPYRYYSPFFYRSYWWGSPWGGFYDAGYSRYHADNIAIISFDKDGNKAWDNVIIKRQDEAETDGSISYQILSSNNNIHFLLNNSGKISSLEDVVISQDGALRKNAPLAAKDKKINFMPRYGKQVGPLEIIIPYSYKNNISFAKVRL